MSAFVLGETMKNKDNNKDTAQSNDKVHITGSVFSNRKEAERKRSEAEKAREAEYEKEMELRRRQREEEHDKRLMEERRELLRLKQGLIDESESTIHEEKEEQIELTFAQKIGNFFYHNAWWLGFAVIGVIFVSWFTISMILKPRPDVSVMIIGTNNEFGENSQLDEYIAGFSEDYNGNGKILASVYYLPYSDNNTSNYAGAVDTRLSALMQSDDAMIVFGNDDIISALTPEDVFADLSELYPDNPHINKYAFMLKGTDFAEKVGLSPSDITDDWFVAIRQPHRLMYTSKEEMQEKFDRDMVILDRIIKDLT